MLLAAIQSDAVLPIKARAARLLGDLGVQDACPVFRAWLGDVRADPSLRREAARALGALQDPKSRDLLVRYLDADLLTAAEALGRLGEDVVLPDLLATLSRPLDGNAQAVLGVALCRLGSRAGVDLLLNLAFRLDGPEVIQGIQGLKTCVEPGLTVPTRVVPDRSEVYQLQLRWNRDCTTLPLTVGPPEPSAALGARIDRMAAEVGTHATEKERKQHHLILVALRTPAASALIRSPARHRDDMAWEDVVRMLVDMGPYAVAPLVAALSDPDPAVVVDAVKALAGLPVQARKFPALPALLARAEPVALKLLAEKRAENPEIRGSVVALLGWIGGPGSGPALAAVLKDGTGESSSTRQAAALSLGLAGAVHQRSDVWSVVQDASNPRTLRLEAAFAASLLGEPRAIGMLVESLDQGPEAIPYLRRLSGWTTFGYEADPDGAVERWKTWWKKYATVIRPDPRRVKLELLWERENQVFRRDVTEDWLAGLGQKARWFDRVDQEARCLPLRARMIPALTRAVQSSPDPCLRFHAVQIMAILGERAAVPSLMHALKDSSALVRSTAAEALGLIGRDFGYEDYSRGLRAGLIPLLQDEDPYVRVQASMALARLRYPDGIPALIELLGHARPGVVDFAWITLRTITDGKDHDFNPQGALRLRQKAVSDLKAWWKREGNTFRPHLPRGR